MLVSVYGFTWLVAVVGGAIPRRRWTPNGRIMVTGTFHNPGWYLSHVTPLARSGIEEVILVVDEPQLPLERVRFVCPPSWVASLISRAGAKALWVIYAGIRYRPDLYMGYNLVAGGCTALIAGSLLGRPTCYQMTGGQLVLSTVDWNTFDFDKASRFRQRISKAIERLAISVIRRFNLIIVRGNKGRAFFARYGIEKNVVTITGSVKDTMRPLEACRSIDLVFIGRLDPVKQVHQFITVINALKPCIPDIKAAIVGNGPLEEDLRIYAKELELDDNLEFLGKRKDLDEILARSKLFVLPSKSEGLSIAMAEAMVAGVVPVVADVGELGDLVVNGVNGYLIQPNNIAQYVKRIMTLLQNHVLWIQFSSRAMIASQRYAHIDIVSEKWRQSIQKVVHCRNGNKQ